MRRLALAGTVLLAAALLGWTVATWAVAANSRAWFEQGLERSEVLLRRLAPGAEIRARLESFEEGTLSSRARTSWTVGHGPAADPLPLLHDISHGPGWSPERGFGIWRVETRIDRDRLRPADREALERAFGDADPVVFELGTADGNSFTGRMVLAAARLDGDGAPLELGGAEIDFRLTAGADGGLSGDLRGQVGALALTDADQGTRIRLAPFAVTTRFDLSEPCPGGWLSGRSETTISGLELEARDGDQRLVLGVGTARLDALAEAPPDHPGRTALQLAAALRRFEHGAVALGALDLSVSLALEPLSRDAAVGMCALAAVANRPDATPREQEEAASAFFAALADGPAGLRTGIVVEEGDGPPHRLAAEITWPGGPRPATLGELARRASGRLELDVGLEMARTPDMQQILVLPVALGLAAIEGSRVRGDVRLADGVLHLPAGPKPIEELLGPLAQAPVGSAPPAPGRGTP
jgi:hypothetical protein